MFLNFCLALGTNCIKDKEESLDYVYCSNDRLRFCAMEVKQSRPICTRVHAEKSSSLIIGSAQPHSYYESQTFLKIQNFYFHHDRITSRH